jgi:hypothetical protein
VAAAAVVFAAVVVVVVRQLTTVAVYYMKLFVRGISYIESEEQTVNFRGKK